MQVSHTSKDCQFKDMEPAHVMVIDLRHLDRQFQARDLVIQDIGKASQRLGCFQVINHGISKPTIKDAMEAASDFFKLSTEEKQEFTSDDISKPVRYDTNSKDGISKARALLKHYAHPLNKWIQFWPSSPPDYREKMGRYAAEARKVAMQVTDAVLESLGLGQAYLEDKLNNGMQIMAINSYPQCSKPDSVVGLAPHSDYGCITILLQSSPGLQVLDRDGNVWKAILQLPGALYIHIGDHLEIISNGRYKTVVHRAVLNPEEKRISVASIHGLDIDEKVTTPKELVDGQNPRRYKDSNFKGFLHHLSNHGDAYESYIDSLRIQDS